MLDQDGSIDLGSELSGSLHYNTASKNFEDGDLPSEVWQMKVEDLEQVNKDLQEDLDNSKMRARTLLLRKELEERRLKQIIGKFESFLKSQSPMILPLK